MWHCQSTARRGTARGGKHTSWETRKKGHCPWCRGTAHEDEALPHWWGTFPSKVTAWEGVSARGGVEGENSRARNGRDVSRAGGDGCRAPVERARRYMCRTSDCGPGLGLRAQTWQREIARGAGGSPRHGFVLWRRSAHPRNRNHAEQTKSIEWSCPKASSRPRVSKGGARPAVRLNERRERRAAGFGRQTNQPISRSLVGTVSRRTSGIRARSTNSGEYRRVFVFLAQRRKGPFAEE